MQEYLHHKSISQLEHTAGHFECPACDGALSLLYQAVSPEMLFPEAFRVWLGHRTIQNCGIRTNASYMAPKTERDYQVCAKALSKFFAGTVLGKIHPGHLMEYQQARAVCDLTAGGWTHPAGANTIRKEIALLIRILKAAKLWSEDYKFSFVKLRAVENDVPRALSPEEQHRFLHVAASRKEWQLIYCYSIVALQTTASTNELRALRLGDIHLGGGTNGMITIRREGAKNKYRMREIPLVSDDVRWALERLIERAKELGSNGPQHYLFPIQAYRGKYDPTRPMTDSALRRLWNQVRKAAGLGVATLDRPAFRIYDLRHTAITRMAEAGTPIHVIMSFAGHVTQRMQQHYTAISAQSRQSWAAATWGSKGTPSYTPPPTPAQQPQPDLPVVAKKPPASEPAPTADRQRVGCRGVSRWQVSQGPHESM